MPPTLVVTRRLLLLLLLRQRRHRPGTGRDTRSAELIGLVLGEVADLVARGRRGADPCRPEGVGAVRAGRRPKIGVLRLMPEIGVMLLPRSTDREGTSQPVGGREGDRASPLLEEGLLLTRLVILLRDEAVDWTLDLAGSEAAAAKRHAAVAPAVGGRWGDHLRRHRMAMAAVGTVAVAGNPPASLMALRAAHHSRSKLLLEFGDQRVPLLNLGHGLTVLRLLSPHSLMEFLYGTLGSQLLGIVLLLQAGDVCAVLLHHPGHIGTVGPLLAGVYQQLLQEKLGGLSGDIELVQERATYLVVWKMARRGLICEEGLERRFRYVRHGARGICDNQLGEVGLSKGAAALGAVGRLGKVIECTF